MYTNKAKNPLRTFLGLNPKKKKEHQGFAKKDSYKKKSICYPLCFKFLREARFCARNSSAKRTISFENESFKLA